MCKKNDDLHFDSEDVHEFNDNCTSIGMDLNLPYTSTGADYEDTYGTQSCSFGIIDNDKTNLDVSFSLSNADDSVILEWDFSSSSKVKGLEEKIYAAIGGGPQAIGEFVTEHNIPLEVIRNQTSEVMDLIENQLHEILGDLESAGII